MSGFWVVQCVSFKHAVRVADLSLVNRYAIPLYIHHLAAEFRAWLRYREAFEDSFSGFGRQ